MVCCSEERVEVSNFNNLFHLLCSTLSFSYLNIQRQIDDNTKPQDLGFTDYTMKTFNIYLRQVKFIHKQINSRVKFEPLYRGTTDGFTASAFHAKVDNKGPTLTFIRTDGSQVIGVYQYVSVSSTKADVEDKKAVIFSVSKSLVFNQIRNLKKAIQHNPEVLISLGDGKDLVIVDNCDKGGCSSSLGHTF